MTAGQPTPSELHERLLDQFIHYFDTAYELREPGLRREVLATRSWRGAPAASAGTAAVLQIDSRIEAGVGGVRRRRRCNRWAVRRRPVSVRAPVPAPSGCASCRSPGRSGGGYDWDGFREDRCFLLPIVTRLAMESRNWPEESLDPSTWWRDGNSRWVPQRAGTARADAMRAMILYPMNALVEDQLVRLRRALDSNAARTWLDRNRGGNRFYFGRYTGQTPVSGKPPRKLAELRRALKQSENDFQAILRQYGDDSDQRFFMADPLGCESRSRWDMQATPPDILITNYSMLNDHADAQARGADLRQDPGVGRESAANVFTFVIDELHMYRGTPGTEVAYLVRRLLDRLGLLSRPDQLSIIATTASLDPRRTKDQDFLRGFFGSPRAFTTNQVHTRRCPPDPADDTLATFVASVREKLDIRATALSTSKPTSSRFEDSCSSRLTTAISVCGRTSSPATCLVSGRAQIPHAPNCSEPMPVHRNG